MHRIPYGREQNTVPEPNRPVVIAMHGLMASSADWVTSGPGTALAYTLADAGFDVWLGNARGTFYSKRHVSLDPDKVSNKTQLHYIGHSQGTTAFWVMGSMRPEYNDKIISMQAYAPVAYLEYNANPLFLTIAPYANVIDSLARLHGIGASLSRPPIVALAGRVFCSDDTFTQDLCSNLLFWIGGYSSENAHNATMLPVYLAHSPAGASVRQIAHYGQFISKDLFRRYDYGNMLTNWDHYRSFTPPAYDLSNVTAPVYMHYVDNDVFADLRDMNKLWNQLGRPVAKMKVPYEGFSHIDFAWGQNAKAVLYDRTVEIIKSFPNN